MFKMILVSVAVALCGLAWADGTVMVDFAVPAGPVKPLHGVNRGPLRLENPDGSGDRQDEFAAAGIPYVRLHDTCGAWGGAHYVDIPNIFPDFDADENDPKSYDFAFTDAFMKPLVKAGCRPFYRLGVTIETRSAIRPYNTFPPKDFAKWARICEHVVRHYNEGWAGGFRWGIEYWEIWNEPEGRAQWRGTREQFFELYRVAANHLKRCFPSIRIGGYGSIGFYAVDQPDHHLFGVNARLNSTRWAEQFLAYVTAPETKAPLDFFSWHLYVRNQYRPERIALHADFCRRLLDRFGLSAAESIFDEWNFVDDVNIDAKGPKDWDGVKEMKGAASVASAFAVMQQAPIDEAMYYCAMPTSGYCGLFYFPSMRTTPCYESFRLWNELYRLGRSVRVACTGTDLYAAAATDGRTKEFYVVNNAADRAQNVTVALSGAEGPFALRRFGQSTRAPVPAGEWRPGETLALPPRTIAILSANMVE